MNFTFFGRSVDHRFILGILVALHVPYLVNCLYANPAADDFEYAASALKHGFWNSYVRDYYNWNGRYTDNFFAFASPLLTGSFAMYKLAAFILFMVHYFSLFYFLRTFLGKDFRQIEIHIISLSVSLLYLFNAPSLTESFYWYTGAISYQLPQSLSLIYFSLLFRFVDTQKNVFLWILVPLLLFIVGFNEVIMLLMVVIHILILIRIWQLKTHTVKLTGLLLFVSCIGAAVMVFSPGNAHRAAHFSSEIDQVYSLKMSVMQVMRFIINWVGQSPLICISVLFVPVSLKLNSIPFFKERFFIHPAITLLALPAIIFLCVFPAYWGTGILGQHRTLNTAYFFFVLIWFMNVHNFVCFITKSSKRLDGLQTLRVVSLFSVLFIGGICLTNNGYKVWDDLASGRSRQFNDEMQDRFAIIAIGKEMSQGKPAIESYVSLNGEDVQLKKLSVKPKTLFILDITSDPHHWINGCWEDYFNVEKIRTVP